MGKTYAAIRIGELLDPDFTIDNIGFETLWYLQQADKSKRGAILVLDEPNRAAGNRSWYTEENRGFSEYLQTNAYRGIHGLFSLPHAHLIDNSIAGVCTAQIVMDEPGHGALYTYERDQLNRSYQTYTPHWGQLYLKRPDAKLCHAYEKKRDEYTRGRNLVFMKRLADQEELAVQPPKRDIVKDVLDNYESFTKNGRLSPGLIMGAFPIGHNKAYEVKVKVEAERLRRTMKAIPVPT